jgi:hypothetical protein
MEINIILTVSRKHTGELNNHQENSELIMSTDNC